MKNYALVLGGYVNGYSIIRELHEKGVANIALFSYGKSLATKSNKLSYLDYIDKSSQSLKKAILKLKENCDYIVIFPSDDLQLENLHAIFNEIKNFCYIPFRYENILQSLDKYVQYNYCEEYDIPYPKTKNIESVEDIHKIEKMIFPVLVKPNKRNDLTTDVFRSLFLESLDDLKKNEETLSYFLSKNLTFLASEYIPGDDTNIYAYVGYRSEDGNILNEWTGKKLTQYPNIFGVFSSASNEAPEVVGEQGRKLLNVMNLKGIAEPEFKYDIRDGKYKLMEINLRSMMWHRTGNLSNVNIQYTQYLDAIGETVEKQQQEKNKVTHFIYMKHEILNLLNRKGYYKHFKYNVFSCKRRSFAVWDFTDVKPFWFDFRHTIRSIVGIWLRALKLR